MVVITSFPDYVCGQGAIVRAIAQKPFSLKPVVASKSWPYDVRQCSYPVSIPDRRLSSLASFGRLDQGAMLVFGVKNSMKTCEIHTRFRRERREPCNEP